MRWIHKEQEIDGRYMFNGQAFMTRGVMEKLNLDEVASISLELGSFVYANKGADYLQIFTRESDGLVVFCIDDRTHWTMLLASEY